MNIKQANNELKSFGYVMIRLTGCPKHTISVSIQRLPIKADDFVGTINADTTDANLITLKIESLVPNKPLMIINNYCESLKRNIKGNQNKLRHLKRSLNY